jgi:hypothetical protein
VLAGVFPISGMRILPSPAPGSRHGGGQPITIKDVNVAVVPFPPARG